MVDPKQHASNRGAIETILRYIPGFSGYLEKEYRRDADTLTRKWIADRLDRAKSPLDTYGRMLVDLGQIDQLPMIDRLRAKLDTAIGRLRGAMPGYSGFFDFVQIGEDQLDDLYDYDGSLITEADTVAGAIEKLPASSDPPAVALTPLIAAVNVMLAKLDERENILKGIGSEPPTS
ncbi:hypothetical protein [Blastopirellula marina]|uniref:Uncharacterized protein n=1 Tax=Blastopirellula marina DSM 3645 TaxID=314230 RepID=A3ZQ39_9BACT|nr:hypothetical protein [Blastopirellula marina]EAQ81312.1 hypothetical protein DSM3645_23011 [Blastopirellula marina DSM 3645]